jgi:hypothetical protein
VLESGICECLWLGDNDVTLSMVKRAYQNLNSLSHSDLLIGYIIPTATISSIYF